MKSKWWVIGGLAGVATVLGLTILPQAIGPPVNLALTSKKFYRTAMARVYSFGLWTLAGETATTVGNALASLAPSFVTGLIRFESTGLTLTAQMLADYAQIQSIVKAANPNCLFDLWLRPTQFTSAAAIVSAMQTVKAQAISFDAWSFDNIDALSPATQTAIFNEARAEGKLIGGDAYNPSVPLDYAMLTDIGFLPPAQVNQGNIPRLLHIANGPNPIATAPPSAANQSEHYIWNFVLLETTPTTITFTINGLPSPVTVSRASFVTQMAQLQSQLGFGFCYPVFWPGESVTPPTYYNSSKDGMQLQRMQMLAAQFNVPPK